MRVGRLLATVLLATKLQAQQGAAEGSPASGSWGLPFKVGIYHAQFDLHDVRACSASRYGSLGVEVHRGSTSPLFGVATLELFSPWTGIDDCQVLPRSALQPDGRIRTESFRQLSFRGPHGHLRGGLGVALSGRDLTGESRVLVGVTRGQDDFRAEWFPTVSASLGAAVVRHFVIHFEMRWLSVPRWVFVADPGMPAQPLESRPAGALTAHSWQRMTGFSVGWRF